MTRKPSYGTGEVAELYLHTDFQGEPKSVIVSGVEIFSPSGSSVLSICGVQVEHTEEGVQKVSFSVPLTWVAGTYSDKWTFLINGIETTVTQTFNVSVGDWSFSESGSPRSLDFYWQLMTSRFQKGCKEYIRVIARELYERISTVTNAQCCFVYYYSPYKQEVTDWQDMFWEDGQLLSLMDTTSMRAGDKWYVQVKIEDEDGETILSPMMKFSIHEQYFRS